MESATQPESATAAETEANGAAPAAPETFEVHRPVDGSVIREVPITTPEEVAEAVAAVRAAQPAWEAIGFDGRYHWLGRLRDWMFRTQTTSPT